MRRENFDLEGSLFLLFFSKQWKSYLQIILDAYESRNSQILAQLKS